LPLPASAQASSESRRVKKPNNMGSAIEQIRKKFDETRTHRAWTGLNQELLSDKNQHHLKQLIMSSKLFMQQKDTSAIAHKREAEDDIFCGVCVAFWEDGLNIILQVIMEEGIPQTCGLLCDVFGNGTDADLCNVFCEIYGIYKFIELLMYGDIDPVWLCQEFLWCPENECFDDCLSIDALTVEPPSGPLRTNFEFVMELNVEQKTGTGVGLTICETPDQYEIEFTKLNTGFEPGVQNYTVNIDTAWNEWDYVTGYYTCLITMCGSDCDDLHGVIFDYVKTGFTITDGSDD